VGDTSLKDARQRLALLYELIREEVLRFDEELGPLCPDPTAEAGGLWDDLLSGRATLTDRFDHAGRRFFVVRRTSVVPPPSSREREVLELAALGFSNRRIARRSGLALATVATYLSNGIAKLGIASRLQLVQLGAALGVFPD
jgi:ATP/maltotriose-dependent transcriptional regulator MalT